MQTMTTPAAEPTVPGVPNFRLAIAVNDPDDGPQEIRAERSDLEDLEAVDIGNQLAEFVSKATYDEFNDFYKVLTTWVRNRRAGCPVDFYRAALIDRLEPDSWHNRASQELLVYGFERLLALANQVRYELTSSDDSGARLRELIDALPTTLELQDHAAQVTEPGRPGNSDAPKGNRDQGLLRATFSGADSRPAVTAETDQLEQDTADSLAVELAEFIKGAADTDLMRLWWVLRTWRRARTNGRAANFQEAAVLEIVSDFGYQGREAEEPLLEAFHKIADLAQQVAKDEDCYGGFGAKFREVVDTIPAKFEEPEIPEEQQLPSLRWDG